MLMIIFVLKESILIMYNSEEYICVYFKFLVLVMWEIFFRVIFN